MSPEVTGFVRHLLTLGAGWLISRGWLDGGEAEVAIGIVIAIIGFVLSYMAKRKARVEAEMSATNAFYEGKSVGLKQGTPGPGGY